MAIWIILGIIVVVLGYAVSIYNSLVKNRQLVQEGWSGIDVQLKRRTDLIPNLMEAVKGYMSHERDTLQAVTEARVRAQGAANAGPAERAAAEGALSGALGRLIAVAEAYPDLKASHNFNLLDARGVISVTERQSYILRIRDLAKACGSAWLETAGGGAED